MKKVVLPVVDVNAVVVGGVAVDIVEIVDVKVDTADSEEVVAEIDIASRCRCCSGDSEGS